MANMCPETPGRQSDAAQDNLLPFPKPACIVSNWSSGTVQLPPEDLRHHLAVVHEVVDEKDNRLPSSPTTLRVQRRLHLTPPSQLTIDLVTDRPRALQVQCKVFNRPLASAESH